jgi:hypothetical protein
MQEFGKSEVLLAAVYNSQGQARNDTNINELLALDISRYWREI